MNYKDILAVLCDGEMSNEEPVLSGVPQGTVLGPLLFLLFINDIPSVVDPNTRCRLFADDCLVYRVVNSIDDQVQLQRDLATLETWSNMWGMQFNAKKCHVMSIHKGQSYKPYFYQLCGTILKTVPQEKYLGVLISDDMSWSPHIKMITNKAYQRLGFIRRNLRGSPQACKQMAYTTLVRSGLEYASIIWDPHLKNDVDSMERVQRKAARWVTSTNERHASVTDLLCKLQWETLEARRKQQRLIFMYKVLNEQVAVPTKSIDLTLSARASRVSDNSQKLYKPRVTTTEFQNSFVHRTIPGWNTLPSSVAQADTVSKFKCRLLAMKP